jgi:hypothetical protein
VLLAVVLSGCTQPGTPPPGAARSTQASAPSSGYQSDDPHWSNAAYAACLRKHSVPVTGPDTYGDLNFGSTPTDRSVLAAAQQTCSPLWPPARAISVDAIRAAQVYHGKLTACLRTESGDACRAKLGPGDDLRLPSPQSVP